MRVAERGIEELQAYVDTLIIIPNQNLFRVANDRTTFSQAFAMADDVLHSGVRGVTDLIVMPGLINLDFADIKAVMSEMGKAMMGTGESEGEERALKAAEAAISNPLLDDVSMKGARGVLINITGGPDMMLFEVDQAANRIRAEVDPDANIIFGGTILENMEGRLRVSVVATGIETEAMQKMPQNVEPLRGYRKPQPLPTRAEIKAAETRAAAMPSPVHHQMETLAHELNAKQQIDSQPEPLVLADVVAPMVADEEPVHMPAVVRAGPLRPEVVPEEAPKRRFGFFGSHKEKKPDMPRVEPAARTAQSPRATAQVITRPSGAEPQRAPNAGEDLFPDHKKDDQFEIPAFLRRQTN
jgi:cell division protein FtsZ